MILLTTCSRRTELHSLRYKANESFCGCCNAIVFCNFHYVAKIIFKAFPNRTEKAESNSKGRDCRIVCFSKKAFKTEILLSIFR